jgi:hypothetical protein
MTQCYSRPAIVYRPIADAEPDIVSLACRGGKVAPAVTG